MTALACIVLAATALVHVLPVAGVLGAARLQSLYGISAADPGVGLLLQHRAVPGLDRWIASPTLTSA